MDPKFRLLWVDIETTGLDPNCCAPLEIAMFFTDTSLKLLADPISYLVTPPEEFWIRRVSPLPGNHIKMNDYVREMHSKNGLLDEIYRGDNVHTPAQADAKCYCYIEKYRNLHQVVLSGAGCHFEDKWLPVWFPLVWGTLHYRQVNISMFKVLLDMESPERPHRALKDLLLSREILAEVMEKYHAGARLSG